MLRNDTGHDAFLTNRGRNDEGAPLLVTINQGTRCALIWHTKLETPTAEDNCALRAAKEKQGRANEYTTATTNGEKGRDSTASKNHPEEGDQSRYS
eukprot:3677962-Alexandrium_andersonii.AAC.1